MTLNHQVASSAGSNKSESLTNKNRAKKSRVKMTAMLFAGVLIGATALTAATSIVPFQPANAQSVLNRAPKQGFADLVEKVMPTVVSVEVKFAPVANDEHSSFSYNNRGEGLSPRGPFDFFERFSKRHGQDQGKQFRPRPGKHGGRASGSGFIISADGYVVTNNHVVKNATQVLVTLANGEEYQAKVVGKDPKTDLAVLKLKASKTFPFVKLAAKDPRVGDWVVAVGNPFGLGGTVTTGIVSANGRNIGSGPYDNFLQIDASINKGNSGGPAFNLNGEVIGVNTAIYSPSGGSVGIGFAIPASTTRQIVDDLINNGSVTRGWLGVQIQSITKDIAKSLGLKAPKGTLVAGVSNNSPAARAGLKTGDTIISVDGKGVKGPQDLARKIAGVKPGATLAVGIVRKGSEQVIKVKIGTMPGADKLAGMTKPKQDHEPKLAKLGIAVEAAEDGRGLVVRDVDPRGAAATKGIKRGDVIVEVDGVDIDDPRALGAVLERFAKSGKETVLLLLRSGDRQRFVAVPLQKNHS